MNTSLCYIKAQASFQMPNPHMDLRIVGVRGVLETLNYNLDIEAKSLIRVVLVHIKQY